MKKYIIPLLVLLPCVGSAQLKHIQHETFLLDTLDQVHINVVDPFVVEHWAGNRVMTETQVQLYQASENVLEFFRKQGRYNIQQDTSRKDALVLFSQDTERKPLRTKHGDCEERIKVRIFLPENFTKKSDRIWIRPPKEEWRQGQPPAKDGDGESDKSNG